ncbi:MAG: type I restriction endonuclease subunit R [Candidatus Aminicenantes bacterium]|nr:type I restriction endonuclease subunit R [Candidatus Aminicenantes bacterium]
MTACKNNDIDDVAINLLRSLDYSCIDGLAVDPKGKIYWKRENCRQVILKSSLENAVQRLNPHIPTDAAQQALTRALQLPEDDLIAANEHFHKILVRGVAVEYREQGEIKREHIRLMDYENPQNNQCLAAPRFIVEENQHRQTLDIVLFINGLPLVVMAFQESDRDVDNHAGQSETPGLRPAYRRLQTWKEQFPLLFRYNALAVITDGFEARAGSLSAGYTRFMMWRSFDCGKTISPLAVNQLSIMIGGLLSRKTLPDVIKHFTVFERVRKQDPVSGVNGAASLEIIKKIAAYHQYYAVNLAVEAAVRAASVSGDQRCGVVWHTQGSGKSMTMLFFAAKLALAPQLNNPTILVITDRNDLEDQLFELFAASVHLLGQTPGQARSRRHLKQLLQQNSGGILFTTVQKFFPGRGKIHPLLSLRRNIIVMADEAHRSQYDFIDGFARHMRDALPNASFIGFTGTPLEQEDRNTRAVFGEYIDIYDIRKAVEDRATVPIYYEGRLVAAALNQEEKTFIDTQFETVTRDQDPLELKQLKSRWAKIESIVGSQQRIRTISRDIVSHFEQRQVGLFGKAMVVAFSRRVSVELYREITRLRPEWHSDNDFAGAVKTIITGTSLDPAEWQPHIRDKTRRRVIGDRLKDPADPLKIVIVCDMWLTGFDVPCLHTLYIDKPLKDHILMQAIARVNRVFLDKPGGLVVDYLGIAVQLKKALSIYIDSGGKGTLLLHQSDAVARMQESYEIIKQLLDGFSYNRYFRASQLQKNRVLLLLQEHILSLENGKEIFAREVTLLSRAFALSVPHPAALRLKDETALFQLIRSRLHALNTAPPISSRPNGNRPDEAVETAVRQIISKAVVTEEIVDIFAAAGIQKPGFSILSEEFLDGIMAHPHPHVALELLKNLLKQEIDIRARRNLVQGRSFLQMLGSALRSYRDNQSSTQEVIEQLIRLAREIRQADSRKEQLELTDDELAFYDALVSHDSARRLFPEKTVKLIARQLVEKVKENATIDWAVRESARSRLKVNVKRTLRIYKYPIEGRAGNVAGVVDTILKQAELLADAICKERIPG